VKYCNFSKIILIGTPWEANTHPYQLHFVKLKAHYSVHNSSPLVTVTSGPLGKLYHRPPVLIKMGYTFLERISPHRTILQTTILTSFYQNYTALPVEWSRQYLNIFAFCATDWQPKRSHLRRCIFYGILFRIGWLEGLALRRLYFQHWPVWLNSLLLLQKTCRPAATHSRNDRHRRVTWVKTSRALFILRPSSDKRSVFTMQTGVRTKFACAWVTVIFRHTDLLYSMNRLSPPIDFNISSTMT